MFHCARHGYIVVFGTGKYLGSSDFDDFSTQALYGIWDYGDDTDSSEFLGAFDRAATPNLSNQPYTVSLLEQIELVWSSFGGRFMRITSDYKPIWATEEETSADGELPNPSSLVVNHAGWYFDLPLLKERIIRNPMIVMARSLLSPLFPKAFPVPLEVNQF